MAYYYRVDKPESFDKAQDVSGEIVITVARIGSARVPMTSGIRHDNIIIHLQLLCHRGPAGSARH
jgi:hypothetical protein